MRVFSSRVTASASLAFATLRAAWTLSSSEAEITCCSASFTARRALDSACSRSALAAPAAPAAATRLGAAGGQRRRPRDQGGEEAQRTKWAALGRNGKGAHGPL